MSGAHGLLGQQDQQGQGVDARSLRQPDWRPNPRRRPASASLWRSLGAGAQKQPHQHGVAAAAAAVKTAAVASSRRGHYEFPPGVLRRPSSAATARAKAKAGKQRRSRGGVERGGS